jgi:uncharacterized repeat protein (TIGR03803 family)
VVSTNGARYRTLAFGDRAWDPYGAPTVGSDGNLYGTTTHDGEGYGSIWRFVAGRGLQILHRLRFEDGSIPAGRLIEASDGNLYGTALNGGTSNGTIFRVTPDGVFTVVHRFEPEEGSFLFGGVIEAPLGLYGTTTAGGLGAGTFFRVSAGASGASVAGTSR